MVERCESSVIHSDKSIASFLTCIAFGFLTAVFSPAEPWT